MKVLSWLAKEKDLWASVFPNSLFHQRALAWSTFALLMMAPGMVFAQGPGVDQMFANFSSSSIALFNLVMRVATLLGILITIKAVLSLKDYSESGGRTQLKTPVILLAVGVFFFSFPATMSVATQSIALGNFAGTSVMSEGIPTGGLPGASAAITGVLLFVKLVGIIAAVRGFLLFKAVGEGNGQASVGAALTFVLGGAMAVNIETTYGILKNSVGWG